MDSIPTRVARGVRYLDDHKPEWRRQVSEGLLDMGNCTQCVLGQLFGNFNSIKAKDLLCDTNDSYNHFCDVAKSIGMESTEFFDNGDGSEWHLLTIEWRKHLTNPEYIQEFP